MAEPILIVDDDADVRDSLRALLESAGFDVRDFSSAKAVLADGNLTQGVCLIADIRMAADLPTERRRKSVRRAQVALRLYLSRAIRYS